MEIITHLVVYGLGLITGLYFKIKKKLNSKNPKYLKEDTNAPIIKKRILMCTAPNKVKVYGVWYED